ncbi:MAG: HEPN domain-containing protein [Armatimonadetes bacterium]|nr:HEPN domain-containing protein [Armatimonadota bacterium]
MVNRENADYRLRLAKEHLDDARFELAGQRWSKAAMSAQLAVENAAKSVVSLARILPRTHDLAAELMDLESEWRSPSDRQNLLELADLAQRLGHKEHVLVSYGDEVALRTPAELYDENKGRRAVAAAERAVELAAHLGEAFGQQCTGPDESGGVCDSIGRTESG